MNRGLRGLRPYCYDIRKYIFNCKWLSYCIVNVLFWLVWVSMIGAMCTFYYTFNYCPYEQIDTCALLHQLRFVFKFGIDILANLGFILFALRRSFHVVIIVCCFWVLGLILFLFLHRWMWRRFKAHHNTIKHSVPSYIPRMNEITVSSNSNSNSSSKKQQ